MKLIDAEKMCKSLMRHHGVYDFEFKFSQRRKRFNRAGAVNYKQKVIKLQPVFVELNHPVVVKWTILHEIAHVISGWKNGHNKFWRKTAIELGHSGSRYYGSYVKKD